MSKQIGTTLTIEKSLLDCIETTAKQADELMKSERCMRMELKEKRRKCSAIRMRL